MNAPAPPIRFAGLLLAGGRSTRFGGEKAVAPWRGRPMMTFGVEALASVCEAVAVSAREGSGAAAWAREHGLPVLSDDAGFSDGPLAGVAAGTGWARQIGCQRLLTVPCDVPLLGAAELARLIAQAGEHAALATTPAGPEPLVALWPTDRFPIGAGHHPSVRALLRLIGAREVRFPRAAPFANRNRPGDLERRGQAGAAAFASSPRES